jgi:hypothetical protein
MLIYISLPLKKTATTEWKSDRKATAQENKKK